MTPASATYADLQGIVTFLVLALLGLWGCVAVLTMKLEDGCPRCIHCQDERRKRKAKREAEDAKLRQRYYGWDGKPVSPRQEPASADRERLFGRQVVDGGEDEAPARGAEPQGADEHDAGREEPRPR